ncbi:Ig-like domain-containing protein [Clostridium estertheticum]|uniref:Ig-like domain-containing protein n=1 Tax=Clostridium estertheticum TaxID=238834 RepID=UPI001C0CFC32|nr:Ig-like domain-containing protein [Clostridium estertheticum]MBU3198423.1 hypothetical protein [Clostridium estertheticum]WAG65104.1 Ig-like domain-containing protein [Clostridium estertheticum]
MIFRDVLKKKKQSFKRVTSVFLIISMVLTLIGGFPKTVSATTNVVPGNWSAKTDDVNGDWSSTQLKMLNTPEAQVMVRTGDIDNFGIGWNSGFDPFSGAQTNMPQTPFLPSGEPWKTDTIMVPSGYSFKYKDVNGQNVNVDNGTGNIDQFLQNTRREDTGNDNFYLQYDQFVNNQTNEKISVDNAKIQMYLGDFQPKNASRSSSSELWNGNNAYTFKINNTYIPEIAAVINSLDQTGHKGQLITVSIPSKYLTAGSDVRQALEGGNVPIRIDDTNNGATGDAFAVDFIKLLINTKTTKGTTGTTGMSVNVSDSSNQVIAPYTNSGGTTINKILNPAVKLAANANASISYGFNDVTFSKYKFVQASDLATLPQFPEDTAMTTINLPTPNTAAAYKDDIGKRNYLTTKHYEYAGNAGAGSARNVSFGTPSFDGVYEQEAVTDSTKNPVQYDLGSTNGSNFYVSNKNGNTTSYGNPVTKPTSNTILYNGKNYPKTKYASWKAMKMWGYFVPKQTGSYVLGSWSDDGAYGYIMKDGVQQVFVDNWALQAPTDRTKGTAMQLTAGNYYPIYMEWYEGRPTQAAFVPEYKFNGSSSYVPIPENELYSSKTTTPGDIAGAYFGDVSGISFPAQDGIYYVATKFKSKEGTTSGLYGPFVIDNTKPILNNLVVNSNNINGNKWAVSGNTLTAKFTASENLSGDPQILINGYATNANITKDGQNNYTATVTIGSDGSVNSNGDKLTDGPITVQAAHYTDLYGNEGTTAQDSTVTYDNSEPTAAITYSSNPTSVGIQVITATYSESIKYGETPQISINQQGTANIAKQNMVAMGMDRKVWTYNYTVNADNGSAYRDGIATVTLSTVHDGAGNLALAPTGNTFTINTKAPTVTLTFSANPVSTGTESIIATYSEPVKSGEIPKISINQQGTTQIVAQNMSVGIDRKTWTYNYIVNADNGSTYKDGIAAVKLSIVHDALNNIAVSPQVNTFTIDTKAPAVAVTYSANPVKAGTELITATYSEPVKAEQIPRISIDQQGSVDITAQYMTSVGTDRMTWTYDYTVETINGSNYKDGVAKVTLSAAQDAAGNFATTPSGNTFIIDTIAPTLTIGAPSSTSARSGPITYTVTYSGADKISLESKNISLVKIGTADGIVTVAASGTGNTRTVTVSNITGDGLLAIRIAEGTANDIAGNIASASLDSTTFEVWNSSPIITAPSDGTITNNNKPTITGTGEAGLLVTVYDNKVAIGTATVSNAGKWSLPETNVLADGKHAITATQSDLFANVSNESASVNITIDTIAPTATITYSVSKSGNGDVLATLNPSEAITITNDDGLQTHNFTDNGTYTFEFIDKAGNIGSAIATVNNIVKTNIIQHGMFINGKFTIKPEYDIAVGLVGNFGVEFETSIEGAKIQMNIDNKFPILDLKLYKVKGGKQVYISNIAVPSVNTGTINISIPAIDDGSTHFILVYRGTVKAAVDDDLTNGIKIGGILGKSCKIKVVKLPDLY